MVRKEAQMETARVGIREFRDKLASYVLESDAPVAITRHGDTVGYFLPTRRKRTDADRTALHEAAAKWQAVMDAEGLDEEEIMADFKRRRKQWVADQGAEGDPSPQRRGPIVGTSAG